MKDHPIAAGLWLLLIVGGIGYLASAGLQAGAQTEKEKERAELNRELEEVIEAGRREEFDVAIQRLERMIAKHPDVAGLYLNLGIAQRAAGKVDEADRSFAKVLELDPKDWDAMAERANVQKDRGDLDRALELMEMIPVGEGRLNLRLREDPIWDDAADNDRLKALREKHGVSATTDTSLHLERQKKKAAPQGVMIP